MFIQKKRREGFTLIELLVVMAVIAILIAIALPVFSKVKDKSRQTQCITNLHAIGQALAIYRTDFKGYPPANNVDYNQVPGTSSPSVEHGFLALADANVYNPNPPYLGNKKAFICPNDESGSTKTDPVEEKYSSYIYDLAFYSNPAQSLTGNKDVAGDTTAVQCLPARHNNIRIELKVSGEVVLSKE
ncbi:MAG: prepilin-type N-terminal cleavage/methylation domain-containing protein [bacterium]|nr:prepilin-type N-terminal cleavage/methylation domain-containing protein [bacterium]